MTGSEQSQEGENIYNRTVDEQLDDLVVTCGTHGELETEDLSVGFDGRIHCGFCSMNQEMDVKNERAIDSTVQIDFHPVDSDTKRGESNG